MKKKCKQGSANIKKTQDRQQTGKGDWAGRQHKQRLPRDRIKASGSGAIPEKKWAGLSIDAEPGPASRRPDGEYCYMRAPASEDATTTPLLRHMVARSLPAWPPAPSPLQANAVLSAPGTAGYVAISAMDGAMEDTDACMLRGRQRQNKRKRSLSLSPVSSANPWQAGTAPH